MRLSTFVFIVMLLVASVASAQVPLGSGITIKGTGGGGGGSSTPAQTTDFDGDGLYEYIRMPYDYDGDGTTWQTCECGSATTPADDAQWLCSAAGVGYEAGDSADNPDECEYDGQRIWDDIGDDFVAIESSLTEGTMIEFEAGTYVMKGSDISDQTLCWDSTAEDFTQTCATEDSLALANVMLRKSGMTLEGQGVDPNGLRDFKYVGTHFVKNKGTRANWNLDASNSDSAFTNGQLCVGYARSGGVGECGSSITDGVSGTALLLPIRKGACYDGDQNGNCDYTPISGYTGNSFDLPYTTAVNLQNPEMLCLDNSAAWVTDNMSQGSYHFLTQINRGGGIGRVLYRVESIDATPSDANCAAIANAVEVVLGGADMLDGLSGESWPTPVFTEVWGTNNAGGLADEPNGTISAAVNVAKLTYGITVKDIWLSHKDWRGHNGCSTAGTEAVCDEGTLITISSGFNHTLDRIGIIQSNTAWGSGGAINGEPYLHQMTVKNSLFRHNTGAGLIDIANAMVFRENYVADNVAYANTDWVGGSQDASFLIRNQGVFYRIENNLFERNFLNGDQWKGGIVDANSDYGTIAGNRFLSTPSSCVFVAEGVRHLDIRDNTFDCGDWAGDPTTGSTAYSIIIAGGKQSEFLRIDSNRFLGGGRNSRPLNDAGAILSQFHVLVKVDGANITEGQFGPGGVQFTDNFVQNARTSAATADAAFLGIRGPNDPDNTKIYLDGNFLTSGSLAIEAVLPAAGTFAGYLDDDDGGEELMRCGTNFVAGVAYSRFNTGTDPGGLNGSNPDQCVAVP